jgi:hypothetical protein
LKQEISEDGIAQVKLLITNPPSETTPLLDVGGNLPNIKGATGLAATRGIKDFLVKGQGISRVTDREVR